MSRYCATIDRSMKFVDAMKRWPTSNARPASSSARVGGPGGKSAGGGPNDCQPPSSSSASSSATERLQHLTVERHAQALAPRVRPRAVGPRRDAPLAQLADVPVLAVRRVPEAYAVVRVEA